MPPLVTELLVGQLYLSPGQYEVPHSPSVGLIRFISLLATTNFLTTPFFLSIGQTFHTVDMGELRLRFNEQRSTLPPLVLVTPYDIRGSMAKIEADGIDNISRSTLEFRYGLVSHCSRSYPDAHVLALMKTLAVNFLSDYSENCTLPSFDCSSLFRPITTFFDITIHLKKDCVLRYEENIDFDPTQTKLVRVTSEEASRTVCRPLSPEHSNLFATLMQELKDRVGDIALILHDNCGGDKIGICFKPGALQEKPVSRVSIIYWIVLILLVF